MFYELLEHNVKEVSHFNIDENTLCVGFISLSELKQLYPKLNIHEETVQTCHNTSVTFQNPLSIYKNYSFGILHIINAHNVHQTYDKMGFYLANNHLLIVDLYDTDASTKSSFDKTIQYAKDTNMDIEHFFCFFLANFLLTDTQALELLERRIEQLEKDILSDEIQTTRQEICLFRREILILHNYYEQLMDICEDLCLDNNHILNTNSKSDDALRHLTILIHRLSRLNDTTIMLKDYLSQVRESYQAQLDISLNRTMKIFTVVAAIFMPQTLIVGWYGMNFVAMPELGWKYGYLYVIILSLLVIIISIYWFKKKGFF